MTTTSFEIFPPVIQRLSCDMIFLMYDFTWSSDVTVWEEQGERGVGVSLGFD